MSDEFDGLDASKDGLDASKKDAKRPSDDVVQTAPVSVDIRKAAFAQTSQAFAFAGRRISRCQAEVHHDADHKF